MREQTLTLSEALRQGYTHYASHPENGYQGLSRLEDLTQDEIDNEPCFLADKETFAPNGLSNEEIKELLAEAIDNAHYDDTGDDTGEVYEIIKALDFSDVEKQISDVLKGREHRWVTNIRLI